MKRKSSPAEADVTRAGDSGTALATLHLSFGWWLLFCFLSLGLVLEALHAFKVGWYLEVAYAPRRFAWTLAHAHGTLLAVVNLILGGTMHRIRWWSNAYRRIASVCLLAATVILPGGFFLGGLATAEGDPGIGIFLVPLGGGLLAISVLVTALSGVIPAKH